jgi:hypothetical protein
VAGETVDPSSDRDAIRDIIARQFRSLSWEAGGGPEWAAFRGDFLPGAVLYPSARPAAAQSLDDFVVRMGGLVGGVLNSLDEQVLGSRIEVFGTVAVAAVACEHI